MIILLLCNITISAIVFHLIFRDINLSAKTAICISLSFTLTSLIYFYLLVFNLNVNIVLLIWFGIVSILVSFLARKSDFRLSGLLKVNNSNLIFSFILFYATVHFFYFFEQWGRSDSIDIWNNHALFLTNGNNWKNLFKPGASTSADYPLMVPSIIAFFWKSMNANMLFIPALLSYLPYIGILYVIFNYFKKLEKQNIGIVICTFLAMDRSFAKFASSQYADIYLAFFFLLTIATIMEYTVKDSKILLLLGLISSISGWIKNEGIVFSLIIATYTIIKFCKQANVKFYLLGITPLLITLIFFKMKYAPPTAIIAKQEGSIINKFLEFENYFIIAKYFIKIIFSYFPMLLFSLFIFFISNLKKVILKEFSILYSTIAIYLICILIAPSDITWQTKAALPRLILHLYPSFLLLIYTYIELDYTNSNETLVN